eukprot:TRINITY_DN9257_c0_g1_i1.p1 TRINITY_DN9257_c0_g1~~TRINITY_DN9257_c0_g1_i1.p1  ORF type:complete len:336 (+),score=79.12 TRINITY_DN9257_c0_g1_i1:28-1008(+)
MLLLFLAAVAAAPLPSRTLSGTLLVANKNGNSATFVDLATLSLEETLPTGTGPHEIAVSADGTLGVVTNFASRSPSTLTVIDLVQRVQLRTISLGTFVAPHGVAFLPGSNGTRVVVTVENSQSMLVVDVVAGVLVAAISTAPLGCHMVVVDSAGRIAYGTSISTGEVAVVDLVDFSLLNIISSGAGAEGIDITPDGSEIWVTNRAEETVSVINTDSFLGFKISSAFFPIRVKFAETSVGVLALVTHAVSGQVAIFDAKTKTLRTEIQMPGLVPVPVGVLPFPGSDQAVVANTELDSLALVDIVTGEIIAEFGPFNTPDGLGYTPFL